jgi:hypothetical protein
VEIQSSPMTKSTSTKIGTWLLVIGWLAGAFVFMATDGALQILAATHVDAAGLVGHLFTCTALWAILTGSHQHRVFHCSSPSIGK